MGRRSLFVEASVALLAGGLLVTLGADSRAWPALAPLATFAVLVAVAENRAVLLPTGLRLSPACMVVMAAIDAFDGRGVVLGAAIVGASSGLVVRHLRERQPRLLLFNCSQYALAGAAAAAAADAARHGPGSVVMSVLAGAAAFAMVNVAAVLAAVVAQGRVSAGSAWRDMAPHLPSYLAFAVIGTVLGLLYRELGPAAVIALFALLLIARSAYASLVGHRRASDLLDLYSRSTHAADLELEQREAFELLQSVRERFNAEVCELLLCSGGGAGISLRVGPGDKAETGRVGTDDHQCERAIVAFGTGRLIDEADVDEAMAARGIRNAAVVPLGEHEVHGAVLVGNRLALNGGFRREDLDELAVVAASIGANIERHRLFRRLRWESTHDALTGHLNRHALLDALAAALSAPEPCGAVVLVDIDGFKEINDTLGHDHGDALLRELATRLTRVASPGAVIGRVGGDEFVVIEPCPIEGVSELTAKLMVTLDEPVIVGAAAVDVSVSVGVSRFPEQGSDALTLLQRAELAMYAAKDRHSGVETYQPHHDRGLARRALVADLRAAIENDELTLAYQPKVELATRRALGGEALARWEHPEHGDLAPEEFIGLAEQTGLIRPLTLSVLRQATRDCARWRADGHDVGVAVNLSAPLLLDSRLPEEVAAILDRAGLPPRALTLEITESSIMRDASRSIAVLERLSAMGVRLSIDDFGTGYSSLAYLRDLPVDEVKIDRSFVQSLDGGNDAIVRLTLELAHSMRLTVVAEGVEDASTWVRLQALSCDEAQGYFFSKPLPADGFEQWLVNQSSPAVLTPRQP